VHPPPTDDDNVTALNRGGAALLRTAGGNVGAAADAARRLAAAMSQLAKADQAVRVRAEATFIAPLTTSLDALRNLLQAGPVTEAPSSSSGNAMILAKLSLSPIATQISSVTTPALRSGISVISTSLHRRSAHPENDRDLAFKIYYMMAWRAGQTGLLQSSLTRAVIYSAMTTATAFASLWLSSHPGTSSMGKLLVLTLICTLAAAVLFQPILMGPPREVERG
jgi:hypothetical protein